MLFRVLLLLNRDVVVVVASSALLDVAMEEVKQLPTNPVSEEEAMLAKQAAVAADEIVVALVAERTKNHRNATAIAVLLLMGDSLLSNPKKTQLIMLLMWRVLCWRQQ